ncbi:MAG TPA: MraY family glycosyltransferase [Actinomycetota bacterium]|nr:MraY family glycosyltransferase [Actinomycetota bacterium]
MITPITSRMARRYGILDHPRLHDDSHKRHTTSTPYLGGMAILLGLGLGCVLLFAPKSGSDTALTRLAIIVAAGGALALVGLVDDVRSLPRVLRLVVQVGAGTAAWTADFRVQATGNTYVDFAITLLWIVGITNAFNLLDNMDGLSAGLAAVSALSFTVLGLLAQLPEVTLVAGALSGACLGFLVHNRHPATVFMGDSGSLLIGFLLALLGIKLRFDNLVEVTFLVPVVVLGVPIFDTTLVVLSRLRHRRPLFLGGRDHVSHRLERTGLPVTTAVGVLYGAGLGLGWLGVVISRATVEIGWMLLGLVIVVGMFCGALLWKVPVYGEPESPFGEGQGDAAPGETPIIRTG